MDFWSDGEYFKGCIAAGKHYLHISANGDIEPCAFIHYSDSSIKETSLLEACKAQSKGSVPFQLTVKYSPCSRTICPEE